MRHMHIVTLDNTLRSLWFFQGRFGLSEALKASAARKYRENESKSFRDSSDKVKESAND